MKWGIEFFDHKNRKPGQQRKGNPSLQRSVVNFRGITRGSVNLLSSDCIISDALELVFCSDMEHNMHLLTKFGSASADLLCFFFNILQPNDYALCRVLMCLRIKFHTRCFERSSRIHKFVHRSVRSLITPFLEFQCRLDSMIRPVLLYHKFRCYQKIMRAQILNI